MILLNIIYKQKFKVLFQNENSESSSLNAGSPVSAGIPAQMTGQLSNQAVIERTRQMILSAQLLSSLNALNSPIPR